MKRILALLSLGLLILSCGPVEKEVAVSSVSLNRSSAELTVGETLRLSATVSPADATDRTVTWSSSNSSVATVSPSGEVTAAAVGSANITASAGGKSASCAVTVIKPTVSVTSVTLDKERLDLTVGGTAKLTATVSPADATDKTVTWESSDATVATVDNDGNVKALKGGTSTVTAKAGGKSASALVDVMDVTPTEVSVGAEGGDIKVTVVTTRKYHVDSKPDWITEGSVDKQVHTFRVAANLQTAERSGVIAICDEAGTCFSCQVKQEGAKVYLTVEPGSVEFDNDGGTATVTVSSNEKWTASADASWCEVTPASGEGDGTFTVMAGEYKGEGRRSATVTVSCGDGLSKTVTVGQYGIVPFDVSPLVVELGEEGGTFDIKITSSYGYHISGMSAWISQKSVSGKVHTFLAEANPEFEPRKGVVTFCDDEGTCLSVEVRQARHIPGPDEVDWSRDFYHRSLVMLFTKTGNGAGPYADRAIKAAQSKKPGRIEPLRFYSDESALGFAKVSAFENQYTVNGMYPTLVVDGRYRVKDASNTEGSIKEITEEVDNRETHFPTVSTVGWESSISGNKLTVNTYVFVKETGEYKYTVLLVEEGIRAWQYDNFYGQVDDYVHDGVVRVAVSSVSGEYFKAYSPNTMKSKKFTVDIPDSCVKENLRIVVYVQRSYGKMMKIHSSDYGDYFIDNCNAGKAGERMLPAVVSTTGGGNEDATEGNPINW